MIHLTRQERLALGVVTMVVFIGTLWRLSLKKHPDLARWTTTVQIRRAPLDLNTASIEQLQTVPGIGPVTARRIEQYRRAHGPFQSLKQLQHVKGIGPKTYQRLRPYLRIAPRNAHGP